MPEELRSLLGEPERGEPPSPLPYPGMLKDLAREALERRRPYDYRGRSAEEVGERIRRVRRELLRCLGLSARALPASPTGVVERPALACDGFSITPIALQRGRGWYVTAHLYVPEGLEAPAPAVMHVHGHLFAGKSGPSYARWCRGLARRGFVVLFVDFPGADEREGTGHALWYPTLAGLPLQGIMVADNSAALTYLAGLPFVDGGRIGVKGASGGGNQTVYFSASDRRVAAAAPCNAPCLVAEHANSGSGAYCHCEAIPGMVGRGVEYHDLLAAIAPRPVRVFTGIRDPLFPIVGARRAVAEASFAYQALGAAGDCTLEEHYCEHECPADFREGTYRFFEQVLKRPGDIAGPGGEGEGPDPADPRLRALPRRPKRFMTVADLYRAKLRTARPRRPRPGEIMRLLGMSAREADAMCLVRREGRRVSRVLLRVGDGGLVPLVVRRGEGRRLVVAMADRGKEEALARAGAVRGGIAAFDWRGQGETAPADEAWGRRAAHYLAMAGMPLPGRRATDLIAVVRWLRREGLDPVKIAAFGPEASMVALLAALANERMPPVELHGVVHSFGDAPGLVGRMPLTAWAPGLALLTDMPNMLAALGKRAVVRGWLEAGEERDGEGYD